MDDSFKTLACISSGLVALFGLSLLCYALIPGILILIFCVGGIRSELGVGIASSFPLVDTLLNCDCRTFALDKSELQTLLFAEIRVKIPHCSVLSNSRYDQSLLTLELSADDSTRAPTTSLTYLV